MRDFSPLVSRDVVMQKPPSPRLLIAPLRGFLESLDLKLPKMSIIATHSQRLSPPPSANEEKYELNSGNTIADDYVDPRVFDQGRRRAFCRQYVIIVTCLLLTLGCLLLTVVSASSTACSTSNVMSWESFASSSLEAPHPSSYHRHQGTSPNTYNLSSQVMEGIMKSPCGHTAAEARARGCHFDIITFCWLPDRCYDAELSDSFEKLVDWKWYLDRNKTQAVPKEEALQGELDGLYVSWEYHVQHCVYMWEKMHRALLGAGKPAIDTYIGPYIHTEHCGKMLLSRGEGYAMSDINTRIRVKFPDCGIVELPSFDDMLDTNHIQPIIPQVPERNQLYGGIRTKNKWI